MKRRVGMGFTVGLLLVAMAGWAQAETYALSAKWNLLSSTIDFNVAEIFGNSNFISVWKWTNDGKGGKTWGVYIPSADGGASYAQAKGFLPLTTMASGEGFWVNSQSDTQVTISGTPVYGPLSFTLGWNLVGLKGTSSVAVTDLGTITSVWKWTTVNGAKTWAVYIAGEGTPGDFASQKGFGQIETLEPGEGFWVNIPVASGGTTTTTVTTSTTTTATSTTTTTTQLAPSAWYGGLSPAPAYPREANVFVFLDESRYLFLKSTDGSADANCTINGIDYGTYTWEPTSFLFNTTALYTTSGFTCGSGGLTQATFAVTGNSASLTVPGEEGLDTISKLVDPANPLVGAWGSIDPVTKEGVVIIFLDSANFMFMQKQATPAAPDPDSCGQTGMEHGTYTWDPNSKLFTATVPVDTTGCWGFSENGVGITANDGVTITITGDTMNLNFPGEGTFSAPRL